MYQELQRLKACLQSKKPYSRSVLEQIKDLDLLDYICCGMILDGEMFTRSDICGMIDGEMPKEASLKQCMMIRNYQRLMEAIRDSLELRCSLDIKLLLKFHSILTGKQDGFRQSNFMAVDFRYVPPHHTEIEAKLNQLFVNVYRNDSNVICNAAMIHCGILAIYPFEEESGLMARIAMNYYLQEKGYFPVALGFSYDEYMMTMNECLKNDSEALFLWGLERAEFNKMTQICQIIESEEE